MLNSHQYILGLMNASLINELHYQSGSDSKKKQRDQPIGPSADVDELSKMMSEVRVEAPSGNNSRRIQPSQRLEGYNPQRGSRGADVAFRVAVSAAECLQAYAATEDISLLLATHRYLLAVQNNQGDT